MAKPRKTTWLGSIRFSGFSALMMGVIVVGVIVLAPNLKGFIEQRQQIAQLQESVDSDQSEIKRLSAERERWNDSTYVSTQARDRLYYVNPGEISFIVINDLAPSELGDYQGKVSDKLQTSSGDWATSLLASVVSAGLAETVKGAVQLPPSP